MPRFVKRIHMHAHANLQLGEKLGGAVLDINGSGTMIMSFEPRISLEPWPIRILEVNLVFEPFRLSHSSYIEPELVNQTEQQITETKQASQVEYSQVENSDAKLLETHHVEIERLHVTNLDFNLQGCYGHYNHQTGEVLLHLEIVLRPERIPQMHALGIHEPLHVKVDEEGHMDFVQCRIIQTHAQTFQIPSNLPKGLLEVRAGQHSCLAVGHLFVAVAGSHATIEEIDRWKPDKIFICPKSQFILAWQIDNYAKASKVQITGGNITPIDIHQDKGSTTIPGTSVSQTTFTLEVVDVNGCKNESSVDVFAITPGQSLDIQAVLSQNQIWAVQLPSLQYDPKIRVTSIASALCVGEQTAFDEWSLYKRDENGTVHAINLTHVPGPLNPFPVPGVYSFTPIGTGNLIVSPYYDPNFPGRDPREENTACFEATMDCS